MLPLLLNLQVSTHATAQILAHRRRNMRLCMMTKCLEKRADALGARTANKKGFFDDFCTNSDKHWESVGIHRLHSIFHMGAYVYMYAHAGCWGKMVRGLISIKTTCSAGSQWQDKVSSLQLFLKVYSKSLSNIFNKQCTTNRFKSWKLIQGTVLQFVAVQQSTW